MDKRNKIVFLDGGLACDLFINGGLDRQKLNADPLWIARVVIDDPDAIRRAHVRFIEAGCDVITTSNYQASVAGYVEHAGLSRQQAAEMIGLSADIARAAIADAAADRTIRVAASISPYGATLHNMSEYSGSYVDDVTDEQLRDFHLVNVPLLWAKNVDYFAFETFPALREAIVVAELMRSDFPAAKAWISFTTNDGVRTSYGDSFVDVYRALAKYQQVIAVGVNCCKSKFVLSAAELAKGNLGAHQSFIAYPNNSDGYEEPAPDSNEQKWVNEADTRSELSWLDAVDGWLETGLVGYIGGCCLVKPSDIKQIKEKAERWEASK